MSEKSTCTCDGKHEGHICVLKSKNLQETLACVTDAPTVVCFNCGAEANSADNVCNPMALEQA
jgi:hypothetical protein